MIFPWLEGVARRTHAQQRYKHCAAPETDKTGSPHGESSELLDCEGIRDRVEIIHHEKTGRGSSLDSLPNQRRFANWNSLIISAKPIVSELARFEDTKAFSVVILWSSNLTGGIFVAR